MNIDELLKNIARNLDTLTKLHLEWREAHGENKKRFAANQKRSAKNQKHFAANEKRSAQVTCNFEIVLDSIKRLEVIATSHGRS